MDARKKKAIIIGAVVKCVQNVLDSSTLILDAFQATNSEQDEYKATDCPDDVEEEKFIHELLLANKMPEPKLENGSFEMSDSLTYFDIIEQEMLSSLKITKQTLQKFAKYLQRFSDLDSVPVADYNLQSVDQFVNLAIYTLMSDHEFLAIEQHFFLNEGILREILRKFCEIVQSIKPKLIQWPTKTEIDRSCQQFERMMEFGCYEFYNVFGAIGTIDISIEPPLRGYFKDKENSSTPIKLQCCCNATGLLQSCFVFFPKKESDTKNSSTFEVNPVSAKLQTLHANEVYIVGDQSLSLCPTLMTPHDKIIAHSETHNKALESKRKIIDKTFNRIQVHFPILNRIELRNSAEITQLIETICILHNFFVTAHEQGYLY